MSETLRQYVEDLDSPDWRAALRAEEALVQAGAGGAQALAQLLQYGEGEPPTGALRALVRIGGPSVPVLRQALRAASPERRVRVVEALVEITGAGAVPDLCLLLDDSSPCVLAAVLQAIRTHCGEPAIRTLGQALKAPRGRVRLVALKALGELDSPSARALVREALQDAEPAVRTQAVKILAHQDDPETLTDAILCAFDPDPSVRHAAAAALLEGSAPERLQVVREVLSRVEDTERRNRSLEALAEHLAVPGVPELLVELFLPERLTPLLLQKLQNGDPNGERRGAQKGLELLPELPVPELVPLLKHHDVDVRARVIQLLTRGGERSVRWVVEKGLRNTLHLRGAALEVLVRIGEPSVQPLCDIARKSWGTLQESAIWALGRIGSRAAIPTLLQMIERGDALIPAAEALAAIAQKHHVPELRGAVPLLRRRMAVWSFPSAEEQRACQAALYAIEAATHRMKDLPVPAEAAELPRRDLPYPAVETSPAGELPIVPE